jgi:L-rhamnose mutarotase
MNVDNVRCNEKIGEKIKRYGSVIKVKPEKYDEYRQLHAAVWPDITKMLTKCKIHNYSIFHRDGFLFSYLEYTGSDFKADMAKMKVDSATQKWWKICNPCQKPIDTAHEKEWWAEMEEIFHLD